MLKVPATIAGVAFHRRNTHRKSTTIPAISTHLLQGEECREMACITPDLIRLSVGGEDPLDIIADLDQALTGG